ncbi:putative LOC100569746 [Trichonephila clavipes]|nr:putative LOC100569746 [Trichonephila clavipes]
MHLEIGMEKKHQPTRTFCHAVINLKKKPVCSFNGDRYRAKITNFFIPNLNNHDVQELWFQQGGATCHTARATIDLLEDTFGDRLISRFGPVNWLPRSCDLTPLDYFLWGYVKSWVYADKPQTRDHLEDNIRRVIAYIRPQTLEKVIENWKSRLDYIRASRGIHMPEIIFKIGIGLIASRQEIPCSVLVEATDGDSPLPLALFVEATAVVGMSYAPLVKATAVSLLEPSEIANAYLLAIGLLMGYRSKSQ